MRVIFNERILLILHCCPQNTHILCSADKISDQDLPLVPFSTPNSKSVVHHAISTYLLAFLDTGTGTSLGRQISKLTISLQPALLNGIFRKTCTFNNCVYLLL